MASTLIMLFCMSLTPSDSAQFSSDVQPSAGPGTYQIIQDPKMREVFTVDVMDSLRVVFETLRQDNAEVIHPITLYTKARIPSRATIESANFIPLDEYEFIGQ